MWKFARLALMIHLLNNSVKIQIQIYLVPKFSFHHYRI